MNDKNTNADYGVWARSGSTSGPELQLAQLVRSLAGRDKGQLYLVVAMDGARVLVADGRDRGVGKPKKKNRRHLQLSYKVAADLKDKAASGKVTDEEIREAINKLAGENAKEGM